MKEARTDRSICLDHSRNPRRVAAGGCGGHLAQVNAEMTNNPAQLFRSFHDVTRAHILSVLGNEGLNLFFQPLDLFTVRCHLVLACEGPSFRTVERMRSRVSGEEGDGVQAQCLGGADCGPERFVVGPLHCAPCTHSYLRPDVADCFYAARQKFECARNAANSVMDL